MTSEEAARALPAYVDGELDAATSLALENRMAADPALRAACERLREMSAAVRTQADYFRAPDSLKPAPTVVRTRRWTFLAPAFATVAMFAFALGVLVSRPGDDDELAREAVAGHVRASIAGRLIDVASSSQHTVKPWLSARLPFSPAVADLSHAGYELAGGRLDYLGGEPSAVLVYKRRDHVIDVYVGRGTDRRSEVASYSGARDGFNVEHFGLGGMRYWVVSDLNRNELSDFVHLLEKSGSGS
jgi:anti-sigma factor RsiW